MASIFTKIVNGEIPCYKISETENCMAFLDAFPLREGHVLVIPKVEIDNLFDLPTAIYEELLGFSKVIAVAISKAYPCRKVGMAVIGLEVPHAHIHLLPINEVGDINFTHSKLILSQEVLTAAAKKIIACL